MSRFDATRADSVGPIRRIELDRSALGRLHRVLEASPSERPRAIEVVLPAREPPVRSFRNGTPARPDLPAVLDAVRPVQQLRARAMALGIPVSVVGFPSGIFDAHDPPGPVTAMVEVSSRCNLRCPTCSVGRRALPRRGDMPVSTFDRLLEGLAGTVHRLALYNLGEPLMHSELALLIDHAKRAGVPDVFVSTNLALDVPERVEALARSGIDEIVVSIDAASEESYQAFRIGGSLATVLQNVQRLVDVRRELDRPRPRIRLQFLLFAHNVSEQGAMRELARRFGVGFEIKAPMVARSDEAWLAAEHDLPRRAAEPDHGWCNRPYDHTTVLSDGQVVACCKDSWGRSVLGNAMTDAWSEIWTGEAYRAFRRAMLEDKASLPLCRSCPGGWFTSSTVLEQERDPWPS